MTVGRKSVIEKTGERQKERRRENVTREGRKEGREGRWVKVGGCFQGTAQDGV